MSQFKFRLETLLKMRIAERDQRQSELSEAEYAVSILQEQVRQVDEEFQAARSSRSQSTGPVDVDQLLSSHRYEAMLTSQRQQILRQQKILDEAVEQRRLVLVEANRKVRTLEKLKENQLAEHERVELLREIKLFDEAGARITAPTR
ncbi:flagellar export protein FliJ [Lignipirellula cremea]|uniref:Flagellar FliJ protein n=1 Tax=Lignipirellula cremea TaxID=2528010 RepID=A0A518DRY9_9BACT|nr:flagellar export protein FliJ [Lignipirellula cremea]QDU94584.1 Flagellar FliJ protein [Lignipirellula cremea]